MELVVCGPGLRCPDGGGVFTVGVIHQPTHCFPFLYLNQSLPRNRKVVRLALDVDKTMPMLLAGDRRGP